MATGSPIAVGQFSDLIDMLVTLVGNDVTGNVLANGDGFGADGVELSITFGGNTYTWNGQPVPGRRSPKPDSGGYLISTITGSSTIQAAKSTALGGNFTFYFAVNGSHVAVGDWAYSGPQELDRQSERDVVAYVLTDNDGDHASAALTISVAAA